MNVKGSKRSKATRLKISLSQRGKNNSMYGKRHTAAALRLITRASRGKNNGMYGRRHSPQTIQKIRRLALLRWKRLRPAGKSSKG